MALCARNHSPEIVYEDMMHKPSSSPPLMFCVVGPPCQPWARGGTHLGDVVHRASLLDQDRAAVEGNPPLACLMEESGRLAIDMGG